MLAITFRSTQAVDEMHLGLLAGRMVSRGFLTDSSGFGLMTVSLGRLVGNVARWLGELFRYPSWYKHTSISNPV